MGLMSVHHPIVYHRPVLWAVSHFSSLFLPMMNVHECASEWRGVPFLPPIPCGAAACHGDLSAADSISRIRLPCALYSCGIDRLKRQSTALIADVMQVSGHFHEIPL